MPVPHGSPEDLAPSGGRNVFRPKRRTTFEEQQQPQPDASQALHGVSGINGVEDITLWFQQMFANAMAEIHGAGSNAHGAGFNANVHGAGFNTNVHGVGFNAHGGTG